MKNIFKILLTGIIIISCASSDDTTAFNLTDDGGVDAGTCNINYCHSTGSGKACCVTNKCGTDYGMGCVAKFSDAN